MFDLERYLADLILNCRLAFGERLLYVGLQGSWLRGEAHEDSDIDVMVILDRFSVQDMDTYRGILNKIGFYEKSCGFICGKEEMKRWNPLEVCQLRHTTKDLLGVLTDYLPPATREDEINYVKLSLGNLYHELCHRYIHADRDKNAARFRGTCKSVFYLIQNLHFLESGRFILRKRELMEVAEEEDRTILELADLPDGYDFDRAFSTLFAWCQSAFTRIECLGGTCYEPYMGMDYQYKRLDNNNFTVNSLDDFVRHQTVSECWRKTDNDWRLVPNVYEENWSQVQCRKIAEDVVHHINLDQTGFGAFDGERIIGFATVSHRIFGASARYVQLVCFQISEEYRRQGIGRKLFSMACEEARRLGAEKLYISAHSSKESQAAYRALGCTPAEEVNEELAAAEPFDVQLEYRL